MRWRETTTPPPSNRTRKSPARGSRAAPLPLGPAWHGGGAWRGRRPLIGCGCRGAAPRLGRGAVWCEGARGGEGAAGSCWKSRGGAGAQTVSGAGAGARGRGRGRGRSGTRGRGRGGRAQPVTAPGPSLAPPRAAPTAGGQGAGAPAASPSSASPGTASGSEARAAGARQAMATTSTTGSTLLQPLSNAVQLPIDQVPEAALPASRPRRPCAAGCHPLGTRDLGRGAGAGARP